MYVYVCCVFVGADGVFDINRTSGAITLLVHPDDIRKEIFNIMVKVRIYLTGYFAAVFRIIFVNLNH